MKSRSTSLSSHILARISLAFVLVFAIWAVWFYRAIAHEIVDETDDALEDYSELLIMRHLAGEEMPAETEASNNTFYLRNLGPREIPVAQRISYRDSMVYIPKKKEEEPARILTSIFEDHEGNFKELTVLTPTFEKYDLQEAILFWIAGLYLLLLLTTLIVNIWVFKRSMRPLYKLLQWLDDYRIGYRNRPLDNETGVRKFCKLNEATLRHTQRSEKTYEEQKHFIGNASHEMQTPLAICQNRLEMLMEDESLSEAQLIELAKLHTTLERLIRQNRSLLLLSKIENGQFIETKEINLNALLKKYMPDYREAYAYRQIRTEVEEQGNLYVNMNESLAATLLVNLLKNAYVHNRDNGSIHIYINARGLRISNTGEENALDSTHVFDRFWQSGKKKESTGLGLSIANSICRLYGLHIRYEYTEGMHSFLIFLPEWGE